MSAPKRFYQEVTLEARGDAFVILLDGKQAKTAGRHDLIAPKTLAEDIRREWDAQTETIALELMPLTRLQGFVLDAGEEGRRRFIDTVVSYAGSDLLCYRASDASLAEKQQKHFSPFLDRAEKDGYRFHVAEGVVPIEQPAETLAALQGALDDAHLSEIFPRKLLTEMTGSAILALYADHDPEGAFAAARLDESHQAESWGVDAEAEARERALRRDYDDVLRYLRLVGHSPR